MKAGTKKRHSLPYPDHQKGDSPLYWLVAYLRDLAEMAALQKLHFEAHKRNRPKVVTMALSGACYAKENEANESLNHVVARGLLLMAFPETTALGAPA